MRLRLFGFFGLLFLSLALIGFSGSIAIAQDEDTDTEEHTPDEGGIRINAKGELKFFQLERGRMLTAQQMRAAFISLPENVRTPSKMRMVSLTALEKEVAKLDGNPNAEMQYLAGLTRIQYVFYYPESKEIVIAGPAEGWVTGPDGTVIGFQSGRPTLLLEDMVAALRAFPPSGKSADLVTCSIDPTKEGLANQQAFMRNFRQTGNDWKIRYAKGLIESIGMHTVTFEGVPADTHLAKVLVAADYRMKLIGLGLVPPPVPMHTFYARTQPQDRVNSLLRWFFVPDYECVRMTEDKHGLELIGNSVKLVEEADMVAADGKRTAKNGRGSGNAASMVFVKSFSKEYPKISVAAPVFGQLRNVIDMLVCAAHIQTADIYKDSGWKMEFFGDETKMRIQTHAIPTHVEPIINIKTQGNLTAYPMGGGVNIEPEKALDSKNVKSDEKGTITETKKAVSGKLADGQWWWDAK